MEKLTKFAAFAAIAFSAGLVQDKPPPRASSSRRPRVAQIIHRHAAEAFPE